MPRITFKAGKKPKRKEKQTKRKVSKSKSYPLRCAPGRQHKFTCYNSTGLYQLKMAWNEKYPTKKITTNDPYEIWLYLNNQLKHLCKNEKCWLEQAFMYNNKTNELSKYSFAPKRPASWTTDPDEWLSSDELTNVMKQYEKTYPHFIFIGPSPIDFEKKMIFNDCVWEDLCKFDIRKHIDNGKTKIGIIFNLDPADKEGSHWVATFIDIQRKGIYYYDSNGIKAPPRIKKFLQKVKEQGKQLKIKFKIEENTVEHQMRDGECGMFTLYFIINMLKKQSFKQFKKKLKGGNADNTVHSLRNVYFNKD